MAKLFNRAKMTTSTTGTGTITLGSAASGFQSFADAGVVNGDVVQYVIEEGSNFEIGTGTYSSTGTSLTRSPTESSNSDAAITLAGDATVSITAVAADMNRLQHNGSTKVSATSTGASITGNLAITGTIPAGKLTGALPAIDGSALTGIVSIPAGVIVMWSGAISAIPSGWVICDGLNGTPDLTDRFVIHADADTGGTRNVDATGGANTVTLATGNLPSHTHSFSANATTGAAGGHTPAGNISNAGNHTHSADGNLATASAGAHSHNVSGNTSNTGSHSHSADGNLTAASAGAHSHTLSGNTSNAGSHTHNGSTSTAGNHTHNITIQSEYFQGAAAAIKVHYDRWNGVAMTKTTDGGGSHSHNMSLDSGGAHSHTLSGNTSNTGAHTHDITGNTSNAGAHSHNVSGNTSNTGAHTHDVTGNTSGAGSHGHNFSGTAVGNHTHSVSVSGTSGSTGSGSAVTITPKFYALAFIMKT